MLSSCSLLKVAEQEGAGMLEDEAAALRERQRIRQLRLLCKEKVKAFGDLKPADRDKLITKCMGNDGKLEVEAKKKEAVSGSKPGQRP